jgi:2-polyprenyl-3-methyl-5-hydroxy-6-metoxy-1,4-benzoquinol methylase
MDHAKTQSRLHQVATRDGSTASHLKSPATFAENIYGIVKRVRIFAEWIEDLRALRGGVRLSILDFGCGTGTLVTTPLGGGGDLIHGVDVHEPSIAIARQQNTLSNVTFGTESPSELLAGGERYDVVICTEVLEHLSAPADALRDLRGLLLPGGELFVTVPNGYGSYENLCRVQELLNRVGVGYLIDRFLSLPRQMKRRRRNTGHASQASNSTATDGPQGYLNIESGHVQFFHLAEILSLFHTQGFRVESSHGLNLVCGPYVDFWAYHLPFRSRLCALNNYLADRLPLRWAADWMFRLATDGQPTAAAAPPLPASLPGRGARGVR